MDLTSQMRSPSLGLEPAPDLADVVRRRAGRVRTRRRAAIGAVGAAAVLGAATLVPSLLEPGRDADLAGADRSYGIAEATSSVQRLQRLNGADVVAYWQGDEPCVAAIRVKRDRKCRPAVNPATDAPLPQLFAADESALRVDDRQLAAGVARRDVVSVRVLLDDGGPLLAPLTTGPGFPLPVFSVELPPGAVVVSVEALDAVGEVLGTRQP